VATPAEILVLRRMVDDQTAPFTWSDGDLGDMLDAADGDSTNVAAELWRQKAATFSTMVDVSESGSSRAMSKAFSQALEMAKYYDGQNVVEETSAQPAPRTRAIVRP
jgi:hypothetical protein